MVMLAAIRRYGWMLGLLGMTAGYAMATPTDAEVVVKPMRDSAGLVSDEAKTAAPAMQLAANTQRATLVDTSQLRQGTWSYEVEQMAKAAGCQGSGVWLVSDIDGSQHYQMQCPTGTTYAATCNSSGQCLED